MRLRLSISLRNVLAKLSACSSIAWRSSSLGHSAHFGVTGCMLCVLVICQRKQQHIQTELSERKANHGKIEARQDHTKAGQDDQRLHSLFALILLLLMLASYKMSMQLKTCIGISEAVYIVAALPFSAVCRAGLGPSLILRRPITLLARLASREPTHLTS